MFEADRGGWSIHNEAHIQLDAIYGTLLARFYKRSLLECAFEAIPKSLLPPVIAHDHASIYYEAWKLSDRVNILPNVVYHIEPATVLDLWKRTSDMEDLYKSDYVKWIYNDLIRRKTRI